ncbi:MAG: hypothetical protein HGB10_10355, partial [Coriobacteriia bacterium]|nr:hypothetical protein [Coriobacteriia bacterium]
MARPITFRVAADRSSAEWKSSRNPVASAIRKIASTRARRPGRPSAIPGGTAAADAEAPAGESREEGAPAPACPACGLTGEEFVRFSGRMYGLDEATVATRTEELLQLLELDDAKDKLIIDYSYGM